MVSRKEPVQWKYLRIEILFFVMFYYLFPILTDVEYNFNERHHTGLLTENLAFNLIYGTFNIFPALIFYCIVRGSLFNKKLWLFILLTMLFLGATHYYMAGVYYIVGHSGIFPLKIQNSALRWGKSDTLHFSVIYIFREFLCIVALAYFIRSAKQEAQMREMKEQQLLTELNYLKAQLHPHFFFNTMNNIYSLALKQSGATAPLVAKLADMMRYILYEADRKTVPLTKEIAFITDYIDTEKIRHHQQNQITFDVQGDISAATIEPLFLLPFIENAFKHGLQEETGSGYVHIVICLVERELLLEIKNSKPQNLQNAEKGIGLQNAKKRLNLLYFNQHTLNIIDDSTQFNLTLTAKLHD